MWGKNVDDTHYHHFVKMPDAKYLCGRIKQAKYCFTSEPANSLCPDCLRRLKQANEPVKPRDPSKGKPRELTQATIDLLLRLERLMGGCWNDNTQNRGAGGVLESEGRGFVYPLTFVKADEEKVKYRGWAKDHIPESGLTHKEVLGGFYQFGSNQLPVFENLYQIILDIEGQMPFCYEPAEMSANEAEQDLQRQKVVESRWWHLGIDRTSKERKHLLIKMVYYMCQYYSGFAIQSYSSKFRGRPARFFKNSDGTWSVRHIRSSIHPIRIGEHVYYASDFSSFRNVPEETLLKGCCHYGANEFHVFHNMNMVLRYLEVRYGLEFE